MSEPRAASRQVTLFPRPDRPSLLEQLEEAGYPIPYQCREGYCGACRLALVRGRVEYTTEPLAFVGANELLACSCRVVVDATVEIRV